MLFQRRTPRHVNRAACVVNEYRRAWLVTRLAILTRSAALVIAALGFFPIDVARKWRLLCHSCLYQSGRGCPPMAIGWARGVREARQDQGWWGKESGARHWRATPHFMGESGGAGKQLFTSLALITPYLRDFRQVTDVRRTASNLYPTPRKCQACADLRNCGSDWSWSPFCVSG